MKEFEKLHEAWKQCFFNDQRWAWLPQDSDAKKLNYSNLKQIECIQKLIKNIKENMKKCKINIKDTDPEKFGLNYSEVAKSAHRFIRNLDDFMHELSADEAMKFAFPLNRRSNTNQFLAEYILCAIRLHENDKNRKSALKAYFIGDGFAQDVSKKGNYKSLIEYFRKVKSDQGHRNIWMSQLRQDLRRQYLSAGKQKTIKNMQKDVPKDEIEKLDKLILKKCEKIRKLAKKTVG